MSITLALGQAIRWGLTLCVPIYFALRTKQGDYDFELDKIAVPFFIAFMWAGYWLGRLG